MGIFSGKRGLIVGVANENSIAWAIAKVILEEGGHADSPICPTGPMTRGSGIAAALIS